MNVGLHFHSAHRTTGSALTLTTYLGGHKKNPTNGSSHANLVTEEGSRPLNTVAVALMRGGRDSRSTGGVRCGVGVGLARSLDDVRIAEQAAEHLL